MLKIKRRKRKKEKKRSFNETLTKVEFLDFRMWLIARVNKTLTKVIAAITTWAALIYPKLAVVL